jgi:hypothetical protein
VSNIFVPWATAITSGTGRSALGQWDPRAHVEGEAEHAAGVGRVEDPVVPEAGGRVIRAALRLVVVADRRAERLLIGGRPGLAAALELIALDRREHGRRLGSPMTEMRLAGQVQRKRGE